MMPFIANWAKICPWLCFLPLFAPLKAQNLDSIPIELYFYDQASGRAVAEAAIYLPFAKSSLLSDPKGYLRLKVPKVDSFLLQTEKKGYKTLSLNLQKSQGLLQNGLWYAKIPMQRANGYLLDISLVEFVKEGEDKPAYSVEGCQIEVYNRTLHKEELNIAAHSSHSLNFILEQGNEYIFLIRKKGFYSKRLRANVNVNGCILCMEGFGTVSPNTASNLTSNNTAGSLITSVSLKKLLLNETVKIDNIYYDKGKAELRPESIEQLNKLSELLRDNPQVIIELNAHTDSRGSSKDNLELSQKRAEAVLNFLTSKGGIDKKRLTARGYGESQLVNSCADGVDCDETLHQPNRRTEFTVVDILQNDDKLNRSLASIMQEEDLLQILEANEEKYVEVEDEKPVVIEKPKEKRPPLPIPMQYTGYKILLQQSKENPSMDMPIFADFEQIFLDVSPEGRFLYLTGDFVDKSSAETFLKGCRSLYPQAKLVRFQNGLQE